MSVARRKKIDPAKRKFFLERDLSHLIPIAKRPARQAGRAGLSVESVKNVAENGRFLPALADRGYLSMLYGRVMIAANLEKIPGKKVKTPRVKTRGGNWQSLWRARAA